MPAAQADDGVSPRATPRRRRGRETLERLLLAATTVFERDGYLQARVTDIAREAGVAHGTFYLYFSSKDDIFRAVARTVVDEMYAAVGVSHRADTPGGRIHASNEHYLDLYERHAAMMGHIEQVATFDEEFRTLRLELRNRFVNRIAEGIVGMQKRGDIADKSLHPWTTASALGGMVDNFAYTWFVLKQPFDRETALATLDTIWLRALGVDEDPP